MHFIPSGQRQRSRDFDMFVEGTTEVINRPEVATALDTSLLGPDVRGQINTVLAGAFLPNVSHGKVFTPAEYLDSGTAILPESNRETRRGLLMDGSMYQITEARTADIARSLGTLDPSLDEAEIIAQTDWILHNSLNRIRQSPHNARQRPYKIGICEVKWDDYDNGLKAITRPTIFINAEVIRKEELGASIVSHEVLHAIDADRQDALSSFDNTYLTYTELRAHYLMDTIAKAALPAGLRLLGLGVDEVEAARQQYNTSAAPFATPPELVNTLQTLRFI